MIFAKDALEKVKENKPAPLKTTLPMISDQWVNENTDIQMVEAPVPLNSMEKQLNSVRDMGKEFKLLKRLTETPLHKEMLVEYDLVTSKLNRYQNIVPCKND